MRWSLTRGQTAAIALLVIALLVDAVLTLHNIREVATSVQWVSHTHEVLSQLEQVMSTLKDAETGQRGYLLTGERPYLEPYEQALPRLHAAARAAPRAHHRQPAPDRARAQARAARRGPAGHPPSGSSTSSRPSPTRAARSRSRASTSSRARASA